MTYGAGLLGWRCSAPRPGSTSSPRRACNLVISNVPGVKARPSIQRRRVARPYDLGACGLDRDSTSRSAPTTTTWTSGLSPPRRPSATCRPWPTTPCRPTAGEAAEGAASSAPARRPGEEIQHPGRVSASGCSICRQLPGSVDDRRQRTGLPGDLGGPPGGQQHPPPSTTGTGTVRSADRTSARRGRAAGDRAGESGRSPTPPRTGRC